MKLHLPNSAHLQNIEGFFRRFSPEDNRQPRFTMHKQYVHMHPCALAMAACLGELMHCKGVTPSGSVQQVRSLPYLIRMKLFEYLRLKPGQPITAHEESGRFIPLTQIKTGEELHQAIVNLVPLLHAPPEVADPIKYVFSEMVRNVLEHANSEVGAFVCAQYYRNRERLSIGIADAGVGIRKSIARSHNVRSAADAIVLALQPGITGATSRIGGNESNAGAGLFFTKSIAGLSRNFFIIYSDDCMFKLLRGPSSSDAALRANPQYDHHRITTKLPSWPGTVVGIDINVEPGRQFSDFLAIIRQGYSIDVKKKKKAFYKRIRFER